MGKPYQPQPTRSRRDRWRVAGDRRVGGGAAWLVIAVVIGAIVFFWGWGWPGQGGWAGWGWRNNTYCPPHTTGATSPTPLNNRVPPSKPPREPNQP